MMCSADGCERTGKLTRGMCAKHYQRWKVENRDLLRPVLRGVPPFGRVMARTDFTGICWEYQGALNERGYGQVGWWVDGQKQCASVHRLVYETLVGPIPDGLELDHLCRVRNCVNPDHLEPVTHRENSRRANLRHCCRRGHPLTGSNLYIRTNGERHCRTCALQRATAAQAAGRHRVSCLICRTQTYAYKLHRHYVERHAA